MQQNFSSLERFVAPIIGSPVWGAKQGYASNLTLNFGEPKLRVVERDSPNFGFHRRVYIEGKWLIWISVCNWKIFANGNVVAHSERSNANIMKALDALNGQLLHSILLQTEKGESEIRFDLGYVLKTAPYGDDPRDDQWTIFSPDDCLTYKADGSFEEEPRDKKKIC